MINNQEINTLVINNKNFILFISLYMIVGTLFTSFLAIELKNTIIIWVGIFIFLVLPFIFKNKFRNIFSKKASLLFEESRLTIELFDFKTEDSLIKENIKYSDIKSFRGINSSKDDSAFIKLFLKNGDSVNYTFLNQGKASNETDVIENLFTFINLYNANLKQEEKIVLIPNFFATSRGRGFIIALAILLAIAIALQFLFIPKAIPISLFSGFIFFLIIIAQSKIDNAQIKKLK